MIGWRVKHCKHDGLEYDEATLNLAPPFQLHIVQGSCGAEKEFYASLSKVEDLGSSVVRYPIITLTESSMGAAQKAIETKVASTFISSALHMMNARAIRNGEPFLKVEVKGDPRHRNQVRLQKLMKVGAEKAPSGPKKKAKKQSKEG